MSNKTIKCLADYTPTDYLVDKINLIFTVNTDKTVHVQNITHYYKNPKTSGHKLILNGSAKLLSIKLNNRQLNDNEYSIINEELTLNQQTLNNIIEKNSSEKIPKNKCISEKHIAGKNFSDIHISEQFILDITTIVYPYENKSCMGLYAASNGSLITQCEPEGFRKITYYPDRPDVLAHFTTTIINKNPDFSVLLSNGNKIADSKVADSKVTDLKISNSKVVDSKIANTIVSSSTDGTGDIIQKVVWHDPFRKPCYLFALVIGDFAVLADTFTTRSNKSVKLELYVDKPDIARANHAMQSLKKAMQWDENRFNLEYDLDTYMIVATSDFNMGAMENKGLNIFNTKYILADKDTATDTDFIYVEAVIAHEYFHNWTGNRVTCRDWFQLSLKEGLTVFRDHQFTADLHNKTLKRIQEVKLLRQVQFPEDSGPLSHSVRPLSYIEIDNFYTATVYEKGAEVVRMYQTILGNAGFNRGLDLYLKTNDGTAATCEDFCQAMMQANNNGTNGIDLTQFMLWYSQAGTPHITVTAVYNSSKQEYQLIFTQTLNHHKTNPPATSKIDTEQAEKINPLPMLIPVRIGLIDQDGYELTNIIPATGSYIEHDNEIVLLLTETSNTFTFTNIKQHPVPSLFREFSAPIKFEFAYTEKDRLHLINHDSDEFTRWDNFQTLLQQKIIKLYNNKLINNGHTSPETVQVANNSSDNEFWLSCKNLLNNINLAPEFRAILFQLPTFSEMLMLINDVNPQILASVLSDFAWQIGDHLFDSWMELYNLHLSLNPHYDFNEFGRRSLKNTALFYIMKALSTKLNNPNTLQLIETIVLGQYHNAQNMTDSFAVLTATADLNAPIREQVLDEFYTKWENNELVLDKWFAVQASSQLITTEMLNKLMVNKKFIATNPNKIYALLRTFTTNGLKFHTEEGYSFIADKIINIDKFNPHLASILAQGFSNAVYLAANHKRLAKFTLNRILEQPGLSSAVKEILNKITTVLV